MALKNSIKEEISNRYHEKDETLEDIAAAMKISPTTVSKYKDYNIDNIVEKESPSSETTKEKATDQPPKKKAKPSALSDEERLDAEEMLDKIIIEASETKKRRAIVRMVARTIGKDKESLLTLNDGLRTGGIIPAQRDLILRNWANYREIEDYEDVLKKDKEEQIKKDKELEKIDAEDEDKEGEKKKTPIGKLEEYRKLKRKRKEEKLIDLEMDKEIKDYEMELSGEGKKDKEEEEKKLVHIIDGVSLNVTPQEKMAWMRYEDDRKKQDEEREERKAEREDERTHKGDDLVEWVIGEGKEAKTVKVRPETIPMLIQSQGKKGGESDEIKVLREETKQMREDAKQRDAKFQQFQNDVLYKKIEGLEALASQDPIDRLFDQKNKLEKLGIVTSDKASAQDRMYKMEGKKLDTMLEIALDKSKSVENKMDLLVEILGPLAKERVQEAVITMRQQQGEEGETVTRTDEDYEKAADVLEEIEKKLPDTNIIPEPSKKVISIPSTKKKTKGEGK